MKRVFDLVVASLLLILTLPILSVAVTVVWLSSSGPVFFGHTRCGRKGVPFKCLKFRTMVVGAQDWLVQDPELREQYRENGFKLRVEQDPRITKVGRPMRRAYLDELPQLINVLRGDMSLVGPRPIIEEELEWYGDSKDELLSVRPGIFGPWTAQGKSRVDYPKRVEIELSYIRDKNPIKDGIILARNIPAVLSGQPEN